ncbi:bis(5'-nucleosyl)-tetraphosphatase (symmetrical) YqeK [Thermophilibacter sp. ET337]|uniref:bis(5'-nucleosyl)-tetraphosphatase (symmetrical) YqeK n=1 Tax=Thermophilibacter sp. ET337 TaxID=2973084 RepID=UPI0021ABC951|nr:bis(5'-nucleosyl)-tetraphosphatase (symmetrical) YqeK [Thermophilibacter sp. ET337]MCR8908715.1 bis(5'-nucleosyl)-tetraphosphatase (symmetrical) YqeK [Thermophilibacter sp. ET337]
MGRKKEREAKASYTPEQEVLLGKLEADLAVQLSAKPKRLAHSLSVARTAERLALTYGADPFLARAAGILHDWEKALSTSEQLARARELGIDLGVELELVHSLLHGMIAARELPARYPELPPAVWHAIAVHTSACADMSALDEVLFVADGIEPLRPRTPGIERSRSLVGKASLDDLFWESFVGGITYVLEGGRYLYPGTIDVYNALAARRARRAAKEKA